MSDIQCKRKQYFENGKICTKHKGKRTAKPYTENTEQDI